MNYILTEEILLFQKRAGIITESKYKKSLNALQLINEFLLLETESSAPPVDDLIKKTTAAGVDIKDEEVQLDILDKLIDSNFQPEKVDPKQIAEYKKPLEEDAGAIGFSLDVLENSEVLEKLTHALDVPMNVIQKAIGFLKKIAEFPFNLIKKFFFKIARFFGASIESAEKWGVGGLTALAIICLVYGILHFPALLAALSGGFGIIALCKLGYALVKSAVGLNGLWKKFKNYKSEESSEKNIKTFSPADFFTSIEQKYKEKTGEKIPDKWYFTLKDWYDNFKTKEGNFKPFISKAMNDISIAINQNKKQNEIGKLIKLIDKYTPENTKVKDILLNIQNIWKDNLI